MGPELQGMWTFPRSERGKSQINGDFRIKTGSKRSAKVGLFLGPLFSCFSGRVRRLPATKGVLSNPENPVRKGLRNVSHFDHFFAHFSENPEISLSRPKRAETYRK